jgi:uncharacterized protein YraI
MTTNWKLLRRAVYALALVAFSADLAAAAPARLASNTNLRLGPGTNFGIAVTVPGGALVNVIRCGGEWCNVTWRGRPGYMIARNLMRGGAARVVARPVAVVRTAPVVVAAPAPVVVVGAPYYWGPRYYYGYGPRYYWRRW